MERELWGTFSVGDHLRRRAFVADVLLYDRLVIPIPPESEPEEQKRWQKMGWRPMRQHRLLDLIGQDKVIKVPWTESHRVNWESRYRNALVEQQAGYERAMVKSQMAQAAAADVSRALKARDSFDWDDHKKRGGRPEEVDQLAHFTTRDVLVNWSNMKNDTKLFMGLPRVQVNPVVAYGSYSAFNKDHLIDPYELESKPSDNLLNLFGWEFLIPNDSKLSDEDLLKQAVEIANYEETKQHREIFHRWRREMILSGKPPREVLEEMEGVIRKYRSKVLKSKIATGAKYAFAVVTAVSGAVAVVVPPFGVAGAFAGFGSFVLSESVKKEIPKDLKVAAMFHDARRRFGWKSQMRRGR